jgi:hypothetical protein
MNSAFLEDHTGAPDHSPTPPLLTLRLTDGHSRVSAFTASTHRDLREQCLAAWARCAQAFENSATPVPPRVTVNRTATLATMPCSLQLHVLDTWGEWIVPNRCTDRDTELIVRRPGPSEGDADQDADEWLEVWLRCLRAWLTASELDRLLGHACDMQMTNSVRAAVSRDSQLLLQTERVI